MHNFFEGWYMKCQSDTHTFAVIPAIHEAGQKRSCSVQLITEENVWNIEYPAKMFCKRGRKISIQNNMFSPWGIRLCMNTPDLRVRGKLTFGPLAPLNYDIMGPFKYVPFMQCRHSVFSMSHKINGEIKVNDQLYNFENGIGYIEGDCGRSFPKKYIWTQCCFENNSLMLSVADIPFLGIHFTGIIGVVFLNGKEYRIATYLGAKIKQVDKDPVTVKQGSFKFTAKLLRKNAQPLAAPTNGDMCRTIHESASCAAHYRFSHKDRVLCEFTTDKASFEFEY